MRTDGPRTFARLGTPRAPSPYDFLATEQDDDPPGGARKLAPRPLDPLHGPRSERLRAPSPAAEADRSRILTPGVSSSDAPALRLPRYDAAAVQGMAGPAPAYDHSAQRRRALMAMLGAAGAAVAGPDAQLGSAIASGIGQGYASAGADYEDTYARQMGAYQEWQRKLGERAYDHNLSAETDEAEAVYERATGEIDYNRDRADTLYDDAQEQEYRMVRTEQEEELRRERERLSHARELESPLYQSRVRAQDALARQRQQAQETEADSYAHLDALTPGELQREEAALRTLIDEGEARTGRDGKTYRRPLSASDRAEALEVYAAIRQRRTKKSEGQGAGRSAVIQQYTSAAQRWAEMGHGSVLTGLDAAVGLGKITEDEAERIAESLGY